MLNKLIVFINTIGDDSGAHAEYDLNEGKNWTRKLRKNMLLIII